MSGESGDRVPDKKPLLEDREMNWPDDWGAQTKVENIAHTLRQPRTVDWVAERAGVDPETAREYLDRLAERMGPLVKFRDEDGGPAQYAPDPEAKMLTRVRELSEKSSKEIVAERADISDKIDEIKDQYDITSPDALRNTIDDTLTADERRQRQKLAHKWETYEYRLSLLEVALTFRRHKDAFLDQGTSDES